ncbi:uncharacterized protein BX664DRAFT_320392 [Halteromyces radiatus]|uniref:uncharacterized protein n=1 Tax=Halteromyces radiatus TaxID=101107 RepID=UPI00221E392C|nr:uncharacterized protein BX664DRAFT_320392 [Halteromyces radiatus]KAI8099103.1 hypothetical protein BX664DRAFT_320392 [Halteromyces radiatus]
MSHLVYARGISLVANGIFAGLGLSMNGVSVPTMRATKDPLPVFTTTYKNGSKIAIASIVISSVCHFYIYHQTNNKHALWCGILSFVSFPFTIQFMRPINNELFALADQNSTDTKKIDTLVTSWDHHQWFRTMAGLSALMINVFYY